jgi:mRNA degradation ribonuclease J1/J2
MSDFLIPLGGGNEIGGSAYYLSLEGIHVLFDCGARLKGEELYPDYERLLYELNDYLDLIWNHILEVEPYSSQSLHLPLKLLMIWIWML